MRLINQEVDRPICFSTRMITSTIEFGDRTQKVRLDYQPMFGKRPDPGDGGNRAYTKVCYQFVITNTKFETIISDSFNFCSQNNNIFL